MACTFATSQRQIKRPDNPTSQPRPIMSNKCCSGDREGKTKEVVEDREVRQVVCEELCVAKCHAKRRWMSPSATPATQNEGGCHQPATQSGAAPRAPQRAQARHQSQPSAPSATPATRNDGGRHWMSPSAHACHAKWRGAPGDAARPSVPPEPAQCSKCHACHAKRRWMSPSHTYHVK